MKIMIRVHDPLTIMLGCNLFNNDCLTPGEGRVRESFFSSSKPTHAQMQTIWVCLMLSWDLHFWVPVQVPICTCIGAALHKLFLSKMPPVCLVSPTHFLMVVKALRSHPCICYTGLEHTLTESNSLTVTVTFITFRQPLYIYFQFWILSAPKMCIFHFHTLSLSWCFLAMAVDLDNWHVSLCCDCESGEFLRMC